MILVLISVLIVSRLSYSIECDAEFPLRLEFMNTTTKAGNPSTCIDGSAPGYYIDQPAPGTTGPFSWIVYLGDGEVCDEQTCNDFCDLSIDTPGGICEGISEDTAGLNTNGGVQTGAANRSKILNCYFARIQCGSEFLKQADTITPQTIMCRQPPKSEDSYFRTFVRVFVPLCTLDWWLGRGSVINPGSTKFRGAFVLDQLFETLDQRYGISNAPLIVFAGTRGGGVGVLNSIKYLKDKLNGPEIIGLVDSAWFVDTEGFAPVTNKPKDIFIVDQGLQESTAEWIEFGRLDPDCDAVWNAGGPGVAARHRCMITPNIVPFLSNEKIMFIQSQYDLAFLSEMGLLDDTAADRFVDSQSYALNAISFVESFGSNVRSSTVDAAISSPSFHYYFMPSCGTHGYIIPTSIHIVEPTIEKVGTAGEVQFERTINTWENIKVGDLSVEDAVGTWIIQKGNAYVLPTDTDQISDVNRVGVVTDLCTGFLCNPTCTELIIPFKLPSLFEGCGQAVILIYALLMMICLWSAFIYSYINLKIFRFHAGQYWKAFFTGKPLPDFGYERKKYLASKLIEGQDDVESLNLPPPQVKQPLPQPIKAQAQPVVAEKPSSSFPSPGVKLFDAPAPPISVEVQKPIEESHPLEEDGIDLIALAEALTSKDKATRLAAKKAYKEHQKAMAERRKLEKKSAAEREYILREKEAKRMFEERQAAMGLAGQQAAEAEKEAKQKNKKKQDKGVVDESLPPTPVAVELLPTPMSPSQNTGKIQKKAEEELLEEAAGNDYRKVHLMVRDLSYWAPPRHKGGRISRLFRRESSANRPYQILRNVDLAVKPANVHALMGPSGSGKSTLLDVLALIRDSGQMRGAHYINGVNSHLRTAQFLRDWLRHNVSYVRQTDVLFPRMTVREHLQHAAWLLLPQFMPEYKKLRRVQQVIELLELDACAETICGDGGVRIEGGISGGQRRRVSVATQLLRLPACLLLDEPTSGLDSTNALLLVKSLHTLAHKGGLTVVMTIHQPRNEIFALFDQLTILVAGKIVFSGGPLEAPSHFNLDRNQRQDLAVANAILDKLADAASFEIDAFQTNYLTGPLGNRVANEMKAEATDFDSGMAEDLQEVLREAAMGEGRWSWEVPSSAGFQMWVLISRTMKRGGFDLAKSVFLAVLGGVVVGLCFVGIGTATSKTALAYLGVATMTFLQGAFLGDRYLAEKQMFDHESAAGSAVQWTAFLASQFVRDSVTCASEAVAFGIPVYWIGGMFPDPSRFFLYLLLLILIAHVCISSNVMVEIDRDNLRAAALVNVSYVGLGALFNGFIIRLSDLPVYLSWLPYIMVTYWGFAGILINDFTGQDFGCESSVLECATRTGDVVLVAFGFDQVDPYLSILALVVMALIFRSVAVLDFFLRYVRGRGNGMVRLDGGLALEDEPYSTRPVFTSEVNRLGGAMKSMMSARGEAGSKMIQQQKKKNAKETQRVAEAGGEKLAFNEEWDLVGEGGANNLKVAKQEPFWRQIFLSRALMILLVVFDFGFLGVVCALRPQNLSILYLFLAVNTIVAFLFGIQFIVSLCFLVPLTPSGPKDCTWAGANDFVAFICTLADLVILIQLWTNNAFTAQISQTTITQATTFIALAAVARVLRILRVYNFWFKYGRYHEVRAVSWLYFNEQSKEQKIFSEDVNEVTRRTQLKSVRLVANNPLWKSHISTGLVAPPAIDPNSF